MSEKTMSATAAYMRLLENVSSVLDCREEGVRADVIAQDMSDLDAINWVNATTLFYDGYDKHFSPALYYSFLQEYCLPEYAEGFAFFYTELASSEGIEVPQDTWSSNIGVLIDVHKFALRSKELGAKRHWGCAFKAPYDQHWIDAFDGGRGKMHANKTPGFFTRWFGKR